MIAPLIDVALATIVVTLIGIWHERRESRKIWREYFQRLRGGLR